MANATTKSAVFEEARFVVIAHPPVSLTFTSPALSPAGDSPDGSSVEGSSPLDDDEDDGPVDPASFFVPPSGVGVGVVEGVLPQKDFSRQ